MWNILHYRRHNELIEEAYALNLGHHWSNLALILLIVAMM